MSCLDIEHVYRVPRTGEVASHDSDGAAHDGPFLSVVDIPDRTQYNTTVRHHGPESNCFV